MNKKLYIKYDNTDGRSWSVADYSLNLYSVEPNETIGFKLSGFRDYSNFIDLYRRSDIRNQIFRTVGSQPDHFLSVGLPTGIEGQTVSVNSINTEGIMYSLDLPKYNSVMFAFNSVDHPEGAGDLDVVAKSDYYARNIETGLVEKCSTGEAYNRETLSLSIWYTVYQVGDSGIYYMVVNPDLLTIVTGIDGSYRGVDYRYIGAADDTFCNELLNPSIVSGGVFAGNDTILATDDSITIDIVGESIIHGSLGNKIPKNQLPNIRLSVESSVPYTVDNNLLTLNLAGKNAAYVNYKWVSGTFLDFTREQLTRRFVIVKP